MFGGGGGGGWQCCNWCTPPPHPFSLLNKGCLENELNAETNLRTIFSPVLCDCLFTSHKSLLIKLPPISVKSITSQTIELKSSIHQIQGADSLLRPVGWFIMATERVFYHRVPCESFSGGGTCTNDTLHTHSTMRNQRKNDSQRVTRAGFTFPVARRILRTEQ